MKTELYKYYFRNEIKIFFTCDAQSVNDAMERYLATNTVWTYWDKVCQYFGLAEICLVDSCGNTQTFGLNWEAIT